MVGYVFSALSIVSVPPLSSPLPCPGWAKRVACYRSRQAIFMGRLMPDTTLTPPRDREENIFWRANLLQACDRDPAVRDAVRALAYDDWEFFFDAFLWTYDPQKKTSELPFILYGFQREFLRDELVPAIDNQFDLEVDKTRKMGATWVYVGLILWYWLKPEKGNDFLLGSRKEELVDRRGNMDTIMEKIRYMISRLPTWMLPPGYDEKKHDHHMQILNPETGAYLKGEANNKAFGRGGRYKAAFLDEFAYWEFTDEDAWRSLADATDCRLPVSTPNGRQNQFARLRHGEAGDIRCFSIHWKLHPERDEEWYRKEKLRRTDLEVAQELDISYESSAGKRFFHNYNPAIHRAPLVWNPYAPVYACWDFGRLRPAVLFTQKDINDRWMWLKLIRGQDVTLQTFSDHVLKRMAEWFPFTTKTGRADDEGRFFHYGDPRGNQVNDLSDETGFQILARKGIYVNARDVGRVTRAETIRNLFDVLVDGKPAIMINNEDDDRGNLDKPPYILTESMWHAHEALLGGCRYDRTGDREDYAKDKFYEDIMDAAGYGAVFLYPAGSTGEQVRRAVDRDVIYLKQRREEILSARKGPEAAQRQLRAAHRFSKDGSRSRQGIPL